MLGLIADFLVSLVEKIGLNWWIKREDTEREADKPLTKSEEIADISKLN